MPDDFSQETGDAIVNTLLTRLTEKGLYSQAMDLPPEHRAELERSQERYAARQRAAGKSGW